MSLQVWLPLINNMNNQGLAEDTIITSNTPPTSNTSGKLGKCYSFNGNTSYISLDGNFRNIFKGENNSFSIACWLYHEDSTRGVIFGDYNLSNSSPYFNFELTAANLIRFYWYQSSTPTTGSRTDTTFSSPLIISLNWIHIVITYDGTKIVCYVNGNEIGSKTITLCPKVKQNGFYIGRDSRTGGTAFNGKLNDFRIYDHCLSAAEVAEIAKGLVLHYKLNYMNLINKNTLTTNSYVNTNGTLNYTNSWYATDYIPVQAGKTYLTIGLSTGGSGTYIGIYNNSKVKTRTILMTANLNNNFIIQDNEKYVRLSIRNLNNELKNALFYEVENIVYDCSGYLNNGTIVGELSAAAGSPRYDTAPVFNGSSSCIKVNENNWCTQGMQAMTINLWVKTSNWTGKRLFSCTESGGFNTEAGDSGYLRFSVNVYTNVITQGSVGYKFDSLELEIASLSTTNWNMLTFVYDTTGTKTYINGLLHHTYENVSYGIHFNMNARLFLGCEANTANPTSPYLNGLESDFRIYTTVLSAAAIKELYDTSASIDASGNVYARELKEV